MFIDAGDCGKDTDCDKNLYCYQRFGYEMVPGCAGQGSYQRDYCFDPKDLPNFQGEGGGGPNGNGRPNYV